MNDMAAKFTMTNITMTTICIEHTNCERRKRRRTLKNAKRRVTSKISARSS